MLGEHCLMASSGSFSFQPWECWHFPDCLLTLRIMQRAVVFARNSTSVLSFNTSWVVPNFEWWYFAFTAVSCCRLWDTLKNLHSPWPNIPLGCIFQGRKSAMYLCAPAVCLMWGDPELGNEKLCLEAAPAAAQVLLVSAELCLGSAAVKLGLSPVSFPAQYEHKLIGHLSPFTNLLPGYTERTSPCLRRKLISKPLWSHIPWVFLPSITNPGRQPWAQHLAVVQIQTLVMPELLLRFCVHFCTFLMAFSPQNPIILSIPSDRTVAACTWTSWFSLFLSNCVTNNHQHPFTSYLWYFFSLSHCILTVFLAFFTKLSLHVCFSVVSIS